jgi:hypothetical protein
MWSRGAIHSSVVPHAYELLSLSFPNRYTHTTVVPHTPPLPLTQTQKRIILLPSVFPPFSRPSPRPGHSLTPVTCLYGASPMHVPPFKPSVQSGRIESPGPFGRPLAPRGPVIALQKDTPIRPLRLARRWESIPSPRRSEEEMSREDLLRSGVL